MEILVFLQDSLEYGKSTITNRVLGRCEAGIGAISNKNKRGKNTTTDVALYRIQDDTFLLDTPGFQTIDIFEIESCNLDICFDEFIPYVGDCEFSSCTHIKEENCGVKAALELR